MERWQCLIARQLPSRQRHVEGGNLRAALIGVLGREYVVVEAPQRTAASRIELYLPPSAAEPSSGNANTKKCPLPIHGSRSRMSRAALGH